MIIPKADEADGFAVGCGDHGAEIQRIFADIAQEVREGNVSRSIARFNDEAIVAMDGVEASVLEGDDDTSEG